MVTALSWLKPTSPAMLGGMSDDPEKIATWLIQEHGTEGAYLAAVDGASQALRDGEGYRLSIWRDVKRLLTQRAKGHEVDLKSRLDAPGDRSA